MNRERLTILRDHLASLPDERVDMRSAGIGADGNRSAWSITTPHALLSQCGTAACIGGWANYLFAPESLGASCATAQKLLELTNSQEQALFLPALWADDLSILSRDDAIAAIQSMLDNPDDDALPVWPEKAEAGQ